MGEVISVSVYKVHIKTISLFSPIVFLQDNRVEALLGFRTSRMLAPRMCSPSF